MARILLALIVGLPLAWSAPDTQTKNTRDTVKKARTAVSSLTGCLDQQGEGYVLRDLGSARAVSSLKGKAFSDDNFARYVGHKVTVHGTIEKQGQASVVHVTKVDDEGPGCSQ